MKIAQYWHLFDIHRHGNAAYAETRAGQGEDAAYGYGLLSIENELIAIAPNPAGHHASEHAVRGVLLLLSPCSLTRRPCVPILGRTFEDELDFSALLSTRELLRDRTRVRAIG